MIPFHNFSFSIPYIFVFFLLILASIPVLKTDFRTKRLTNNKLVQYYLFISVLSVFMGMRGFLFTDFVNYYPYFEDCPTLWDSATTIKDFFTKSDYIAWEKGFLVFTCLVKSIYANYFFFQFIAYLIDFIILYYFFRLYLNNYLVLGFCFFFIFNGLVIEFNLLRNAKSIMLFLISIKYLDRRKYFIYFLLNILGFLFHSSSIFYILLTPFYFMKFSKRFIFFLWLIGLVFFFLHIKWCSQILFTLAPFLPGRMSYLIRVYINNTTESFGFSVGFIERALTFIVMYYSAFKKNNYHCSRINIIFYNTIFLYLFLYLFFTELPIVQDRIGSLFVFSYWVLYPKLYSSLVKNRKFVFLVFFILYGGLKIISGYSSNIHCWDSGLYLKYDFTIRKNSVDLFFDKIRE